MLAKIRRSVLTILMTLLLLGQLVYPASSLAGGASVPEILVNEPVVSLEQAIRVVKDSFNIPQDYTKFTSGYNTYNDRKTWSLRWTAPDESTGNLMAQVDVSTGEIVSMNKWVNGNKSGPTLQIPSIQAGEAKDIAEKLVTRLAPGKLADIQLLPADDAIIPLINYGPVAYTVRWQRSVNGIPYPADGITVQVSGIDGDILSYNLMWNTLQFPDAKNVISADKAQEAFINNPMLELQYFVPAPIKPQAIGEKLQPRLVYQLNNAYVNGAIDALTGEPIKISAGQWFGNEKGGAGGMGSVGSPGALADKVNSPPLTPDEQREIEKNANLISQDQAVEAVKRWVGIPANLVVRNVNLSMDWSSPETRVWTLDWNQAKPDNEAAQYMYARVNATTGELMSFSVSYPFNSGNKSAVLGRAAAQKIAEEFLQRIQPQRFQEVKLMEESYPPGLKGGQGGPEGFNYYRLVNGVPYRNNGINITVDTATHNIINYNLNWSSLDFPPLTGILNIGDASGAFLKARPLTLNYAQMVNPTQMGDKGATRLIYQPQAPNGVPTGNLIDAKTGEFLDWQGRSLAQLPKAYHFTDIGGSFAEKEIALLGQAGIFGEHGNSFYPDEVVTVSSLLRALLTAKNGAWMNSSQTDKEVIQAAKQQGWLTGDLLPSGAVTRDMLVMLMIRFLQLEPIAKLEGIYQVPYRDVPPSSLGYVALAKGTGMLNIDGEQFEPGRSVSRAEAAYALVKVLSFQR
ncbi:MAG: YcdB/YcdC domain-containing protein [Desulfitobacteriaceae bacterium]